VSPEQFYKKIKSKRKNIKFNEMVVFLENLGFIQRRSGGSHIIFSKPGIIELINIQEESGEAKPYQVKQIIKIIEKYELL